MPPSHKIEAAVPTLAAHARLSVDAVTQRPILLFPEGVLELDEIAAAVLQLCDKQRSLGEIAVALSEGYEAPREEILADILEYLTALAAKGLVRLEKRA